MAKDPYKYFRVEAREILEALSRDILALEKEKSPRESVGRLLRQVHTLKGAARVVKLTRLADLAHEMEETLSPYREAASAVSRETVDGLLRLLDAIAAKLAEVDGPAPAAPGGPASGEKRPDTVRLEVGEVDAVLEGLSEAAVQLTGLRREAEGVERARRLSQLLSDSALPPRLRSVAEELGGWLEGFRRRLAMGLDQAERELLQVHEKAGRLRLLPAGSLFDFLERAARDAARTLGKDVQFETSGGNHRLDAHVLSTLQEALLHLVRNAVAHGVESPPERSAMGKNRPGLVEVRVERRGDRMSFVCRDDGRGLDMAAIRRAAEARGLTSPSTPDPLSLEEAVHLLLKGGVSTTGAVTEVSGRGVGMDVVRDAVDRLRGEIQVASEPGRGTSVKILVPYTLSTFSALTVEAAGLRALIPFDSVRRIMRVAPPDVARSPEGDSVIYDGRSIPFLPLETALSRNGVSSRRSTRPAVVVESASGICVLAVDRVLGHQETVMRSLPALAPAEELVAGASVDPNGNPCLVLDPAGLAAAARLKRPAAAVSGPSRPPILIIDDSLTTRMLEQSILESAGYEVDVAISGEEALAKAARQRYGLFLVDVEMPGMDGFEFIENTRRDAALRDIPSILVTSRVSREDRRRGEAVGALDYIVKGEFDQTRLLARIRELLP